MQGAVAAAIVGIILAVVGVVLAFVSYLWLLNATGAPWYIYLAAIGGAFLPTLGKMFADAAKG